MVAGISSVTEVVSHNDDWPYGENLKPTVDSAFLSDRIKSTHIGAEVRGKPRKVVPGADKMQTENVISVWKEASRI